MNNKENIGINTTPAATFYPMFGGPTMGQVGSAAVASDPVAPVNAAPQTEVAQAAVVGSMGNPLVWWLSIVIMLFLLMFIAKRFGSDGEFASIKLSVYNIIVIALAAIIGINFFKMVFTRFKVPGLSTLVLST